MAEDERMRGARRHRRVIVPGAPGTDPAPQLPSRLEPGADAAPEERGERDDSNDERLRRDVPPHW